jgi:hypothetical protein
MQKTVKFQVDKRFGDEYEGAYELRQVTQGEYEDVVLEYMDAAGHISRKDLLKVSRKMLWCSLVCQPANNPLTLERLLRADIPHGFATKLQNAYDEENGITPDERRFLSEPLEEISPTQESLSSPSAKSSDGPQTSTEEPTGKLSRSSS